LNAELNKFIAVYNIKNYFRNDGSAVITSPIPDTITSWFISAFAMDQVTGLGIAPHNAKVVTIHSLPYIQSIKCINKLNFENC
jgi:hypothetical protein